MNPKAILVLSLCFLGCAKTRDLAPEDLDGLSHYLYANWDDQEALAEGMTNLAEWLETEGRQETATEEGYVLTDLTSDELVETAHPDHPLEDMIGVAVTGISAFDIDLHGELITRADQRWNSEKTYIQYDRVVEEGDTDAFIQGDSLIRTVNTIDKSGAFGVHIVFELNKDYRWVTTADQRQAIIARSWISEIGCANEGEGNNCVNLSFSIDLFYSSDDNETLRMTSSWNHLSTSIDNLLTEEFLIMQLANGIIDIYENTDELLLEENP